MKTKKTIRVLVGTRENTKKAKLIKTSVLTISGLILLLLSFGMFSGVGRIFAIALIVAIYYRLLKERVFPDEFPIYERQPNPDYDAEFVEQERIKRKSEISISIRTGLLPEIIRKDIDGLFYLSRSYNEDAERFTFEHLEFSGSRLTTTSRTRGNTKTKGRAGSALLGGLLFGPVGALVGSSGSRKGKINTTTKARTVEWGGSGTIYLRSVNDSTIKEVRFYATQAQYENIARFFS